MDPYLWQNNCFRDWQSKDKQCYFVAATPGSGKTNLALEMAMFLKEHGKISQIIIVVPTDYLKTQWAEKAHAVHLNVAPEMVLTGDFDGFAITYHAVNTTAGLLRQICNKKKTFAILDEPHHCGEEKKWGASVRQAFEYAGKIVGLTGTPFRTDNDAIPFVEYKELENGEFLCVPDFTYTYGDAIRDGILKTVCFPHVDGEAEWIYNGEERKSSLSDLTNDRQVVSQRKRVAFELDKVDYVSDWLKETLIFAANRLNGLREEIREDCAGIIFVTDQGVARKYETNRRVHKILGCVPKVVYSELGAESKRIIERFKCSRDPWIVSVKQISEGVDITRLTVGVYATVETTITGNYQLVLF